MFPMYGVKHEIFIHRNETAREEGCRRPVDASYPQKSLRPQAAEETQMHNQPRRPARWSDFDLGRRIGVDPQ